MQEFLLFLTVECGVVVIIAVACDWAAVVVKICKNETCLIFSFPQLISNKESICIQGYDQHPIQ
jgi:hypothetical protein